MDNELQDLLENQVLGPEVKQALQEAFEAKVKAAEQKLQEDYAARYDHDKNTLVEAMDRMLNDTIKAELNEFAEDRAALISQRATLAKATREAQKVYEHKLSKHTERLNEFMARQLKGEIAEFVADRRQLMAERKQLAAQVEQAKQEARTKLAERINKLESFVIRNLSEEIAEFTQDKKALAEQRVKLAREGKQQLAESRNKFVSNATKVVNKTLNEVIRKELVQWRDDIKVARENNFGRRIFEAVAAEYMASYLSEGSEVKKLQAQLQEQQQQMADAKVRLVEQQKLVESAQSKAQAASDRVQRMTVLNELLSPLNREKRAIMGDLLKDIRTVNLKEAYDRYLPTVMSGPGATAGTKVALNERADKREAATGNRQAKTETQALMEGAGDEDLGTILYLAGLNKEVREN
jgi:hypothetical protein